MTSGRQNVKRISPRSYQKWTVSISVNVARSEDEAERQARGENVLAEKTEAEEAKVAAEELFEDGAAPKVEAEEGVESE